jgi:hypothetical protein
VHSLLPARSLVGGLLRSDVVGRRELVLLLGLSPAVKLRTAIDTPHAPVSSATPPPPPQTQQLLQGNLPLGGRGGGGRRSTTYPLIGAKRTGGDVETTALSVTLTLRPPQTQRG